VPDVRRTLGTLGENLAVGHLLERGYVVLERNYRCRDGEVDIVARDGDRLAFVEVRARRTQTYGTPEESVTLRKQERLACVARNYLQEKGFADVDWGIDVVALEFTSGGVLKRMELIRNAVTESR
jgi:putative endonuclease